MPANDGGVGDTPKPLAPGPLLVVPAITIERVEEDENARTGQLRGRTG